MTHGTFKARTANISHIRIRHTLLLHRKLLRRPKRALILTLSPRGARNKVAHMSVMGLGTTINRLHRYTQIVAMDRLLIISIRGDLSPLALKSKSAHLIPHSHKIRTKMT